MAGRDGGAGAVTGSGLVRPLLGAVARRGEQVHPFVLAVPALGKVHGEVPAAVPTDSLAIAPPIRQRLGAPITPIPQDCSSGFLAPARASIAPGQ